MSEGLFDQVARGFAVLQQLERKDEEELIPEDPAVTLVFQLWEAFNGTAPYPITIPVRHPVYADSVLPVCVITKDPHDEWKERFRNAMPPFPIKTYSISKWRKRFTTAASRRQLMKEMRLFVGDGRIGHVLGAILGKDFFATKRSPVMVDLTGDDIVAPIRTIVDSCTTAVLPRQGKFAALIGRLSWGAEDIADNACDVITAIFDVIGADKVASAYLQAPGSIMIPVFVADITEVLASG